MECLWWTFSEALSMLQRTAYKNLENLKRNSLKKANLSSSLMVDLVEFYCTNTCTLEKYPLTVWYLLLIHECMQSNQQKSMTTRWCRQNQIAFTTN